MRYTFLIGLFLVILTASAQAQTSAQGKPQVHPNKTSELFRPQNLLTMGKQSGQEVVMLSFYRNANRTPDFKKWSYMTEKAQKAPEYDRPVAALNEQVRLQTIFTNLDPLALLTIQAPIDVSQYSTSQEKLFIPSFANRAGKQGGSIVQTVYGEQLAIIIPELAQFAAIHMTYTDAKFFFEAVKEVAKSKEELDNAVIAEMIVKPRKAIYRKSGSLVGRNQNQSLFEVELAQLTLWRTPQRDKPEMPLWSWKAEWYKPDNDNPALLQLYKALH